MERMGKVWTCLLEIITEFKKKIGRRGIRKLEARKFCRKVLGIFKFKF